LLADEINRASPKTQSALLEAMEEQQVSVDGQTRQLPTPFFVIATQNPQHHAGASALPESQLDRFMLRLSLGFPDRTAELQLLKDNSKARLMQINALPDSSLLQNWQAQVHQVHTSDALLHYLLDLVNASRGRSDMEPLSPRASQALLRASKALALLEGRRYVIADDIRQLFAPVCQHRLQPRSQAGDESASQLLLRAVPCNI